MLKQAEQSKSIGAKAGYRFGFNLFTCDFVHLFFC
jgi:hypothetical protein